MQLRAWQGATTLQAAAAKGENHAYAPVARLWALAVRLACAHTVNDEPQPQVVLALGLRIENCAPCRVSL